MKITTEGVDHFNGRPLCLTNVLSTLYAGYEVLLGRCYPFCFRNVSVNSDVQRLESVYNDLPCTLKALPVSGVPCVRLAGINLELCPFLQKLSFLSSG